MSMGVFVPKLFLNLAVDYVTCYDLIPGTHDLGYSRPL